MKKQLVFIDNDHKERAEEDAVRAKQVLKHCSDIPAEYLNEMKVIHDFHFMERKEKYDILFDENNVIVTWSMYTRTHFNSLGKLEYFLERAASNEITGMIYLDTSMNLEKDLDPKKSKYGVAILSAIETNYIISFDYDDNICQSHRLRVDLTKGLYKSCFKREHLHLSQLFD